MPVTIIPEEVTAADIEYFSQKLNNSIANNESAEAQTKIRNQIALLENAFVTYHLQHTGRTS